MISKQNVPELRFPEFSGEWNTRKLNEVSYKVREKNKDTRVTETFTNSAQFGVVSQRDYFDKDISNLKSLSNYYIVNPDDFVYNPRISNHAPVGPVKRNKLNRVGVMSPLYYVFRANNINKAFLEHYFQTTKWHKFMYFNGDKGARSDRFSIKDSVFQTMPIPYPEIEEQQKIGDFFSKLDRLIELQEKKLELLEEQKKGYMQKIFSQELRFKDEDGNDYPEWEEKQLGEVCKIETGKLDANAMVEGGEYNFYTCAKEVYKTNIYSFNTEALLISGNGANVGYIHYYNGKFNAYQRTYVLSGFQEKNTVCKILSIT